MATAIDYLASLGEGETLRDRLVSSMTAIGEYERALSARFLDGIRDMSRIMLYGLPSPDGRTPTFAIGVEGVPPAQVASNLGDQGIFVWSGDYYAVEVMRRLGVADEGGLVRIGFVHYNTAEEVDRVLEALAGL